MEWLGPIMGLVVLGALFVPIEKKWPMVRRGLFRKHWFSDALHVTLTGVLGNAAAIVGIGAAWLLVGWWTPAWGTVWIAALPVWGQFALGFLLGNTIGYWAHRLSHTVPFLWRFHKVHHSSTELDWLAAARRHPLEETWNALVVGIPLIFLGFAFEQVAILQVVQVLWAVFLHANVRLEFPRLKHIIATPRYHHWHHSADPAAHNTNYALLPIIDRVFGTCYQPDARAIQFGVPGYEPGNYVDQMVEPFRRQDSR